MNVYPTLTGFLPFQKNAELDRNEGMNGRLLDAGLFVARVPLGLFFFRAGWMKLEMGLTKFVGMTSGTIPPWLGEGLGKAYLHALPFAELTVGLLVTLGLMTRVAATVMALMLLSFTIAVTGVFPKDGKPFDPNLIFMGLAIGLALAGPGRWSLDTLIFSNTRKGREPIERAG